MTFGEALREQRWDDHRFYHQSRINQSLHFFSAISFLVSYVTLFNSPGMAAIIGWMAAMCSRQAGHFFFEPKTYDEINDTTHQYKEDVKVGYNLKRKVVLMGLWLLSPFALYHYPTFLGLFEAHTTTAEYFEHLGLLWLYLGIAALIFRTVHLFFIRDVQTGLVWFTKILTDPFHDIKIYHKAPIYLMKGEMYDPMTHSRF